MRPTSAVRRFLNEDTDALTAARQLNADVVLEGSVQRAGRPSTRQREPAARRKRRLVVGRQLRHADDRHLHDSGHRRPAGGLSPSAEARSVATGPICRAARTVNPICIRVLSERSVQLRSADVPQHCGTWTRRSTLLVKAIEADPNFALAHAHLAHAYAIKAIFREPTETIWAERARAEIQRAQALDPLLA